MAAVIAAFGREGDFWPGAGELAGGNLEEFQRLPLPDRLSQMAENYLEVVCAPDFEDGTLGPFLADYVSGGSGEVVMIA